MTITYFPSVLIEDGYLRQDERDRLDIFRHHRHGDQAIAQAVLDLLEGITKIEKFAFAEHPNIETWNFGSVGRKAGLEKRAPGKIHGYTYVTLRNHRHGGTHERYLTPFWCNERGEETDAVITGTPASNPAMFTAALVTGLWSERHDVERVTGVDRLLTFRVTDLPEGYDPDWWISKEN